MRLLELYCGRGGWSRAFALAGWECVGVDWEPVAYPFKFLQLDVMELPVAWIDSFDAVIASPPCEDFARAWLPWLRGDKKPSAAALVHLTYSVRLADRPRRLVECSRFAARHVPGAVVTDSWALWGDVPLLLPRLQRHKARLSGSQKDLRAEIPFHLAHCVERHFHA